MVQAVGNGQYNCKIMLKFLRRFFTRTRLVTTDTETIAQVMLDHVRDLSNTGTISSEIQPLTRRTTQYYGFLPHDVASFYAAKDEYPAYFLLENGDKKDIDGRPLPPNAPT